MVRFIMRLKQEKEYITHLIYIPIWLDLLSEMSLITETVFQNLHSNMVRFIILAVLLHYFLNE